MVARSLGVSLAVSLASALVFVAMPASAKVAVATSTSNDAHAHCPAEMAQVGSSCVDKWEASLVTVAPNGEETPFTPYASPKDATVKAVSRPNVVPQAHISLVQAQAACQQASKRLCKADEWKAACKGPSMTKYPYGNAHVADACVDTNRTAPLGKLYSGPTMFTTSAMNDPRLNQMDNTVEKTGAAAACTNAYGVYDMVGNVHEWVDDGAFHGGYYLDTKINREGCDYATTAHDSEYYDYSTGFRCCADADSITNASPEQVSASSASNASASKESSTTLPSPEASVSELKGIAVLDVVLLARLAHVVEGLGGGTATSAFSGIIAVAPALPELARAELRLAGKRRPRA